MGSAADIVAELQARNAALVSQKEAMMLTIQELRQKLIELQQKLKAYGISPTKVAEAFRRTGLEKVINESKSLQMA
jgi:hypothetical protein